MELQALVFMTARNCEAYVQRAVESVARQTHARLHVLFVDDASTDRTAAVASAALQRALPDRHTLVLNPVRWGKARNTAVHLRAAAPEAHFVAVLDADDELVDERALSDIARQYELGFDVVWTDYETDRGRLGGNRALDVFSSPRQQGWVTSHLFTFRAELLHDVPSSYFQDSSGEWLQSACDLALAYPLLDQTRRYCHLPRVTYRYTETNPLSHHNRGPSVTDLNSERQVADTRTVLAKPPLPCTRFPTEGAPLHSGVAGKLSALEARLQGLAQDTAGLAAGLARAPLAQQAVAGLVQGEDVPLTWLTDVGGWALDLEFLHHLRGVLDRHPNPRVLEFGSGRGTKVLARLCANRSGQLVSVEHDVAWQGRTHEELGRNELLASATVRHAPLVEVDFYAVAGRFYDMTWLSDDDEFDVVVIDGPPTSTGHLARLPALPAVAAHLSPKGFDVFLDDYERLQEQAIVEIWQKVAPDLRYETLTFAKQVCAISA